MWGVGWWAVPRVAKQRASGESCSWVALGNNTSLCPATQHTQQPFQSFSTSNLCRFFASSSIIFNSSHFFVILFQLKLQSPVDSKFKITVGGSYYPVCTCKNKHHSNWYPDLNVSCYCMCWMFHVTLSIPCNETPSGTPWMKNKIDGECRKHKSVGKHRGNAVPRWWEVGRAGRATSWAYAATRTSPLSLIVLPPSGPNTRALQLARASAYNYPPSLSLPPSSPPPQHPPPSRRSWV